MAEPAFDIFIFRFAKQKPVPNTPQMSGSQKHLISFSQMRRIEELMGATNINGCFTLPSLPRGSTEVLKIGPVIIRRGERPDLTQPACVESHGKVRSQVRS